MIPQPLPPFHPPKKMQLISFDIGIKHLAYCIFEYSPTAPNEHNYDILEWNIINLLESETTPSIPPPLCQTAMKPISKKHPSKICCKNASFSSPHSTPITAIEYYCNKHANTQPHYLHPQLHPTFPKYSTTQLSKMEKSALQEYHHFLTHHLPETPATPPPAVLLTTKKAYLQNIQTLQSMIYLQPVLSSSKPTVKANHANMIMLSHALFKQLSLIESRYPQIQQAIIENQIGNIAARMMVIQGMVTMFYTSRNRNIQIEHVSSSHKLKYAASLVSLPITHIATATTEPPNTPSKTLTKYQEHKSHAKDYCEMILYSNPKFTTFYEEFRANKKKKDDLADCFLQGIWFIQIDTNTKRKPN